MNAFIRNSTVATVLIALSAVGATIAIRSASAQNSQAGTQPMMHGHMPAGTSSTTTAPGHIDMSSSDGRELLNFPPQMKTHMLGNMRDHVETLDAVLHALAAGDYEGAAKVAAEHLGLDWPSAAACKPKAASASTPSPGSMDEMMALYMPEQMRAIGLSMHTSASEFATVAARAATTHDPKPAIEALSRVTQNCVACHTGYRLQQDWTGAAPLNSGAVKQRDLPAVGGDPPYSNRFVRPFVAPLHHPLMSTIGAEAVVPNARATAEFNPNQPSRSVGSGADLTFFAVYCGHIAPIQA